MSERRDRLFEELMELDVEKTSRVIGGLFGFFEAREENKQCVSAAEFFAKIETMLREFKKEKKQQAESSLLNAKSKPTILFYHVTCGDDKSQLCRDVGKHS